MAAAASSAATGTSLTPSNPSSSGGQSQHRDQQQPSAPPRRLTISLKPPKYFGSSSTIAAPVNAGLTIHLHPTHFNIQSSDVTYQYNCPLKSLVEAVNKQQLTPDVLKYAESFHNGVVNTKVHDHRLSARTLTVPSAPQPPVSALLSSPSTPTVTGATGPPQLPPHSLSATEPQIFNLELRPTMKTLWSTLTALSQSSSTGTGASDGLGDTTADSSGWTMEFATKVIAALLPRTEPPLCLEPSTTVVRLANEISFNEKKFLARPKRKRDWAEVEDAEAKKKKVTSKLMRYKEQSHEFHPTFSRFAFVEDWKRKKTMADMEVLPGVDSKQRNKVSRKLQINIGKKLVRTVKWERDSEKGKVYTILNIYENSPTDYEAVFRWGNTEGTAAGNGSTLKYPVGNATAVDYYLAHVKGFYSIEQNNLVIDVPLARVPPPQPAA
ncbi:hypothetical protein SeMB42_g07547, partial [Synchytrium endobioticum]